MNTLKNGWFSELQTKLWPGQCMSLQVKEILYEGRSKFQEILVFESTNYGRVLVLDGIIQCTERDEFSYQEMMACLPLNAHPNPEKVLVVGGGDGGVVREIVKHPLVKSVTLCDIDSQVIDVCKKYLPSMACSFDNEKVRVVCEDGFQFLKRNRASFDVVITDSTDPVGPAESLFQTEYCKLLRNALRDGNGIIGSQGECMWLPSMEQIVRDYFARLLDVFPNVKYATLSIPTYPCGQIGCMVASVNQSAKLEEPVHVFPEKTVRELFKWRYYNADVHRAAFALPQFLHVMLANIKREHSSEWKAHGNSTACPAENGDGKTQ